MFTYLLYAAAAYGLVYYFWMRDGAYSANDAISAQAGWMPTVAATPLDYIEIDKFSNKVGSVVTFGLVHKSGTGTTDLDHYAQATGVVEKWEIVEKGGNKVRYWTVKLKTFTPSTVLPAGTPTPVLGAPFALVDANISGGTAAA